MIIVTMSPKEKEFVKDLKRTYNEVIKPRMSELGIDIVGTASSPYEIDFQIQDGTSIGDFCKAIKTVDCGFKFTVEVS